MPMLDRAPVPMVHDPDGRPIGYATQGAGDTTLVLLHPIGLDWRHWLPVLTWFPDDLRVLAVDLRGFGGSACGPPVSLADHAHDLAALLDSLGLDRVHVAGLSYGGSVAGTFAGHYPAAVASLCLVAAPTTANPTLFGERAQQAEQGGHDSYVEATIARWFRPATVLARPAPVAYAVDRLRRTPVSHWAAGWRALSSVDLVDGLRELRVPVSVVAGEHDAGFPPATLAAVAARLPTATFHCVDGVAHMVALEAPFQLAARLYETVRRAGG